MNGYRIMRAILSPIYKFWFRPKVTGKDNIPKDGAIVLAGNHIHIMDQCNVIISTKRKLHYMAKKEYFDDHKVAWFFRLVGCIPVDRSKKDAEAKASALKVLHDGHALGIFPEGTVNRTTDKVILPFKIGAVKMASETNSKIVPFVITGKYRIIGKRVRLEFLKPISVGKDLDKSNRELMDIIENKLKENRK